MSTFGFKIFLLVLAALFGIYVLGRVAGVFFGG
jgi:hypothetical protein